MSVVEYLYAFDREKVQIGDIVLYPGKSSYSGRCHLTLGRVLECRLNGKEGSLSIKPMKTSARGGITADRVTVKNLSSVYVL